MPIPTTAGRVINLRKLAAIDIYFLGSMFIITEYAGGVILSLALGVFILFRSHSRWQVALGMYFICLGCNYLPMLGWAIAIGNKQTAKAELGDELADRHRAAAKYRRQSLLLLFPLSVPLLLIVPRRQRPGV